MIIDLFVKPLLQAFSLMMYSIPVYVENMNFVHPEAYHYGARTTGSSQQGGDLTNIVKFASLCYNAYQIHLSDLYQVVSI